MVVDGSRQRVEARSCPMRKQARPFGAEGPLNNCTEPDLTEQLWLNNNQLGSSRSTRSFRSVDLSCRDQSRDSFRLVEVCRTTSSRMQLSWTPPSRGNPSPQDGAEAFPVSTGWALLSIL